MTYIYNIPNATTGVDDILVQTSSSMPSLVPLFLTFVWLFIFLGGFVRQRNKDGYADASQWAILSSLTTLVVALLFTTINNLINIATLSIVVGITILTGIWYFFSKGRNEGI